MKIPVARCSGCGRVFELTQRGCPDCCGGDSAENGYWDWKHEGWFEEGVMIVWGDV